MDFQPLSVPAQNSDPLPEQEGAVAFTPFAVAAETQTTSGALAWMIRSRSGAPSPSDSASTISHSWPAALAAPAR